MLSLEEYKTQLSQLYQSKVFQARSDCITFNFSTIIFTIYFKANNRILDATGASVVILRIEYSEIYRESTLYIQLQHEFTDVSGLLVTKLCIVPDMGVILPKPVQSIFVIEPEQCDGAIWWCFHQCNTKYIIGDNQSYKDTYLERWVSSYIYSWV